MSKKLQRKLKKELKQKSLQNDPPIESIESAEQITIEPQSTVEAEPIETSNQVETVVDRGTSKWINRQRVLVLASRGITYRDRHLLLNLRAMLPHAKTDSKLDGKDPLQAINQLCEMKNCNKAIYIMNRKHRDCYMWLSNVPRGPSAIFLLENIHTYEELRLPGNCLVGSRPMLSFDDKFDKVPHLQVLKELFTQVSALLSHL
jgi:ribosome biogenesis protein BRX1